MIIKEICKLKFGFDISEGYLKHLSEKHIHCLFVTLKILADEVIIFSAHSELEASKNVIIILHH